MNSTEKTKDKPAEENGKLSRIRVAEPNNSEFKRKEAEKHNIMATPTLIKARPKPEKRMVGDLSNKERPFTSLDLEVLKPRQ
jgi:hypothetical protein